MCLPGLIACTSNGLVRIYRLLCLLARYVYGKTGNSTYQYTIITHGKAPGPDNIPTWILQTCSAEIAPVLQVIFTQSLKTHMLPKDWLCANITPIFKKGDRSSPVNYRPISLTSVCCKIMEHVILSFIMGHLERYNLLNPNQHGFRPNHSCQTQLILLVEDILKAMDSHHQVDEEFYSISPKLLIPCLTNVC